MSRYDVVRTDAGWHARFIAANGRTVFVTESYTRKRAAENAIETITGRFIQRSGLERFAAYIWSHDGVTEVRYVDQRLRKVARPELPEPGSLS